MAMLKRGFGKKQVWFGFQQLRLSPSFLWFPLLLQLHHPSAVLCLVHAPVHHLYVGVWLSMCFCAGMVLAVIFNFTYSGGACMS